LNREFRNKDKPTDVLSFPSGEKLTGVSFLGELAISIPMACKQAKEFGVTVREELLRLLIHGLLHLLGYDHEGVSKSEAQRMRRLERKILTELTN
jgi:probable rRNA maturation factor